MQHRLYGLRGQAYVREYKRLYVELEPEIRATFQEMYDRHQKFTRKLRKAPTFRYGDG